jgi:hypothetical protein
MKEEYREYLENDRNICLFLRGIALQADHYGFTIWPTNSSE